MMLVDSLSHKNVRPEVKAYIDFLLTLNIIVIIGREYCAGLLSALFLPSVFSSLSMTSFN